MQTQRDSDSEGSTQRLTSLADIVNQARPRYLTVGELAYGVIREAIVNGVFEPGDRLRQDALAKAIDVSRIPIRSALLQLETEGLVRFHPHRGAVVRTLSAEQIREIYNIRFILERYALQLAIANMTPARLSHLEELARNLDEVDSGDSFVDLTIRFYLDLYEADRNPLLVSLIERLHSNVGRYWLSRRVLDPRDAAHTQLLSCVRNSDTDGAIGWLEAHLKQVADELVELMESDA
jgi:DNA-binding GntR family transcriptional regulator